VISRLSRIASAGELKLRRRNIAREKVSDLRERHPTTPRLGHIRPKVGAYAVLTPRVYGFPLPINKNITHWWVRWDKIPERTDLQSTDVFVHENLGNAFLLRKQYMSEGWNTYVIMQDITHKGPTTAIAIGYPKEWSNHSSELSKWGTEVILRLHVDICRINGKLASYPHVEPDPEYNPKEHLEMYQKKNEIRGALALQIFREFFTCS